MEAKATHFPAVYYAKEDTWFDEGIECTLVADCGEAGAIMCGLRNGKLDEELCPWDEFWIFTTQPSFVDVKE